MVLDMVQGRNTRSTESPREAIARSLCVNPITKQVIVRTNRERTTPLTVRGAASIHKMHQSITDFVDAR